jgi:uncharacterized protein (DUF849 family)
MDPSLEARAAVLDLTGDAKPDMASLTLGSNNFLHQASVNAPDVIRGLAERMRAREIVPELEVFEPGMMALAAHLVDRGVLEAPLYANVLLGNPGTAPLTPGGPRRLPQPRAAADAVGAGRHRALPARRRAARVAAGGHVRVGLEDNIWFDRGRTRLATNAELVGRVAAAAELAERPVTTPRETRALLGLGQRVAA